MTDDPIVAEVHQTRAKLLAEHNGSAVDYLESLRKRRTEDLVVGAIKDIEELQQRTMKQAS